MTQVNLDPAAQAELAKLAIDLANNPDTRKDFARLTKRVQPNRRFPDVEADEAKEMIAAEFEKRDQAEAAKKAERKLERQRDKLKERYEDKDIEEIEKLMEKHGLADYELGSRLYAADTKPAQPTSQPDDHQWKMPNIEVKDFNNLRQISRAKAYSVIDEIARNRKSS